MLWEHELYRYAGIATFFFGLSLVASAAVAQGGIPSRPLPLRWPLSGRRSGNPSRLSMMMAPTGLCADSSTARVYRDDDARPPAAQRGGDGAATSSSTAQTACRSWWPRRSRASSSGVCTCLRGAAVLLRAGGVLPKGGRARLQLPVRGTALRLAARPRRAGGALRGLKVLRATARGGNGECRGGSGYAARAVADGERAALLPDDVLLHLGRGTARSSTTGSRCGRSCVHRRLVRVVRRRRRQLPRVAGDEGGARRPPRVDAAHLRRDADPSDHAIIPRQRRALHLPPQPVQGEVCQAAQPVRHAEGVGCVDAVGDGVLRRPHVRACTCKCSSRRTSDGEKWAAPLRTLVGTMRRLGSGRAIRRADADGREEASGAALPRDLAVPDLDEVTSIFVSTLHRVVRVAAAAAKRCRVPPALGRSRRPRQQACERGGAESPRRRPALDFLDAARCRRHRPAATPRARSSPRLYELVLVRAQLVADRSARAPSARRRRDVPPAPGNHSRHRRRRLMALGRDRGETALRGLARRCAALAAL